MFVISVTMSLCQHLITWELLNGCHEWFKYRLSTYSSLGLKQHNNGDLTYVHICMHFECNLLNMYLTHKSFRLVL
jgi:hypothetical protein